MTSATPVSSAAPQLSLRVRRVEGAPVVAARLWLWGGSRLEEIPGQSLVTGRLLTEGSRRRDYRRIALDAEERGMLVQSTSASDFLGVSIESLAGDWELTLDSLAELALEPTFPEERLQWICRQASAELESLLDQPEARTSCFFLDQLYHPHPYGRPVQGLPTSLSELTPEHCADFHRQALAWGGCVVVAGDIDEDSVMDRLRSLFSELPSAAELPEIPMPAGRDEHHREIILPKSEQAHLYAGHLTVRRNEPNQAALKLAGIVIGGSMSGRLPERIRDQEGLAYNVDIAVAMGAGLEPGRLAIYAGVSGDSVARVEAVIREELQRLVDDGVTHEELEDARSFFLGRDPFYRETAGQWTGLMAESELYGLPVDRPEWVSETVGAITKDDVEEAARRWLDPKHLRLTVGLPQDRTRSE